MVAHRHACMNENVEKTMASKGGDRDTDLRWALWRSHSNQGNLSFPPQLPVFQGQGEIVFPGPFAVGWGHESSAGQWVVNRNDVCHFQTRTFNCQCKTHQFPLPLTDNFQWNETEPLPTHDGDEHAFWWEINLHCFKPLKCGECLLLQYDLAYTDMYKHNLITKSRVAGVLVRGPPCGIWDKKGHLGSPLTTKNKEVGHHVSQETLMYQWWLSTMRMTLQGLIPCLSCTHQPVQALMEGNPWSSWIQCFEFPGSFFFVLSSLRDVCNPYTSKGYTKYLPSKVM